MIAHYRDMIGHYGEPLGIRVARKHLSAFVDRAPTEIADVKRRVLRSEICRSASVTHVEDLLLRLAEERPSVGADAA